MDNDRFSYQFLRANACDPVYNVEHIPFNYFPSSFQICNWCGENHNGAYCPYYSYSPPQPHYNPSWSSCVDHAWSYQQEEAKRIEEQLLEIKMKQFIQAQIKVMAEQKEALMRLKLQADQIAEIQHTCFQKLQMCAPMNFSTQLAQGESVWDDEITFSEDDKVTFELCHDEQEEMIIKEIEEVSKTKIEFVDIKDDEVQSHSTQFQDELDEKTISILETTWDEDEDELSKSKNAYIPLPIMVIYKESMKGVGLSENPHEKPYILQVILEPKIWHVESALYYLGMREPSKSKKRKMLPRTLPHIRLYP